MNHGQITKKQIPHLLASVDDFEANVAERLPKLKPEFQQWVAESVAELRQRIQKQDYRFCLRSLARHLSVTFTRMESGEIKGINSLGGFDL